MKKQAGTSATGAAQNAGPRAPRRVFGALEVVFDAAYLLFALWLGLFTLHSAADLARSLVGAMALLLAFGDLFHLAPRVAAVFFGDDARFRRAMGFGKLVTSLTMTAFYVLLWHVGALLFFPAPAAGLTALVYLLALVRAALCLPKQNRWFDTAPPVRWGVLRNLPFLLLGLAAAALFGLHAGEVPALRRLWLAVLLSFAFYLPVVLWSNKNRKLGMLMLPKTLTYVWILWMLASATQVSV